MIPVTLNTISNLQDTTTAQTNINANSAAISGAFSTALDVTGDQMRGNLDMNSNQILNLPSPATAQSPVRLMDVTSSSSIASVPPVGTSGAVVPLLNANNTWSGTNTFGTITGSNLPLTNINNTFTGTQSFNAVSATTLTVTTLSVATMTGFPILGHSTGLAGFTVEGGVTNPGDGGFYQLDLNGNFCVGLGNVSGLEGGSFNSSAIIAYATDMYISRGTPSTRKDVIHLSASGTSDTVLVTGTLQATSSVVFPVFTVTTLPASITGARAVVTDSTVTTFGAAVTGGSTFVVPVLYTGSAWHIG